MATCRCPCGASYRVPDSALGRQAKCKRCGSYFTLEAEDDGLFTIADEIGAGGSSNQGGAEAALGVAGGRVEPTLPPQSVTFEGLAGTAAARGGSGSIGRGTARGYASDVLWSFLFLANPGNLASFLVIWLALVLGEYTCLPLGVMATLWFAAFRLNVVVCAASGENYLPDVHFLTDIFSNLVWPCVQWTGTWLIVLTPALAYEYVTGTRGVFAWAAVYEKMSGGLGALLGGSVSGVTVLDVLIYLGIAAWPMVVLCVAMGGFGSLCRADLICVTIVRTFPVYLITLALMFGAVFLQEAAQSLAAAGVGPKAGRSSGGTTGIWIVAAVLLRGAEIYVDIVLMRLIGLYYHHFKEKFAWSWG